MTLPAIGDEIYPSDLDELNRVVWVAGAANVANVAGVTTTETVVTTLSTTTFEANTAYKIEVGGLVRVSVANNSPMFQLRKTNASGQTLGIQARWACCSANASHGFNLIWHFQVGGTAVSAALVATVTGAGTYNTDIRGADSPTWINAYKIESAANITWPTTLV